MGEGFRQGVVVRSPFERLSGEERERLDRASRSILEEVGLQCFNDEAADVFARNGCAVTREDERSFRVKIPGAVLGEAVKRAPSRVKLGARDPRNALVLDARLPRVYFGSGSETNIWLDAHMETFRSEEDPSRRRRLAVFTERRGTVARLARAARLAEQLEHLDFFIRPVNVQDEDITEQNHDVNKFYASLANTTKHVMAGLTSLSQLDNVLRMAELIAGGKEALKDNPVVSFITCTVKSPLQMVDDATQKLIEFARREVPFVVSSSPQGGSTAPVQEAGMVAQINAEILSGIALSQMVNPGAPVVYGSVPVRSRMDNLHDMYGAPEFNRYNVDCVQMARHYGVPCYSTAGVGDSSVPGMQATLEKIFTYLPVAMSGAQYIHYAFGLLERTNVFCPVQAVLDNQHIGMVKMFLESPRVSEEDIGASLEQIRKVMASRQKLYVRFVRRGLRDGSVYAHYPFEGADGTDGVIEKALARLEELWSRPVRALPGEVKDAVFEGVPGILGRLREDAREEMIKEGNR
ncbi:MAG: trimethylamine methyltransferase family protein [Nitrospirota bacterium]|jgi:trimethylamine--corrinoid protein Co-methyltransferase